MKKILKTWWLKAEDGRNVYKDPDGNATLAGGANRGFEFIEGQHPGEDMAALAQKASNFLGVQCVWGPGPDTTEDIYGLPRDAPVDRQEID